MTADERYAQCQTVKELNLALKEDLRKASSKAEEDECNRAYAEHFKRAFVLTMIKDREW